MNRNRITGERAGFLHEIFLASEDVARCLGPLSKLARHLENPVIITGSIATSCHLLKKGLRRKKKHFNDIDVVVDGLPDIRTSLKQDFLINHFHPLRGSGRVLIQLVDEEYGTRIDVFTPNSRTLPERMADFVIGDLSCKAVSIEDVLAKLLSVVHSVTKGETVDPKYVEHLHLLFSVADLDVARDIWRDYRKEGQHIAFDEAAEAVRQSITTNPNLLQSEIYGQEVYSKCQWCQESELFPLAPRFKIYEILGYV